MVQQQVVLARKKILADSSPQRWLQHVEILQLATLAPNMCYVCRGYLLFCEISCSNIDTQAFHLSKTTIMW